MSSVRGDESAMRESGAIPENRKTWAGLWSGLILTVVAFLCLSACQVLTVIAIATRETVQLGQALDQASVTELFLDGDVLAVSLLVFMPVLLAILAFVVKVRRQKQFFEFLGLHSVQWRVLGTWLLYAVLLSIAVSVFDRVFGRPPIPEWMLKTYGTVDHPWLFFLSVAALAPLSEELLYRGYILRVFAESRVGPVVGVLLVSAIWAAFHFQYDLYDMAVIFAFGILLGASRIRTNSIVPAIIIHVGWNMVGVITVALERAG